MKKIILVLMILTVSLFANGIKLLDEKAVDLAYQLPLKKYPNFLCEATLENGKVIQFVSVKSMFQVYFHQEYFLKHKLIDAKIKDMYIQDYLNKTKKNAKRSIYVFGSRVPGPHGDDLIPFKDKYSADLFKLKYGGTKTLPFDAITIGLIRYLDM
ncbi:nitrous oxide reductase accessory protein NosL [Sulfurospirillum sp. 1307]|jgi:nitrous oxide reductase accessory protein NosL